MIIGKFYWRRKSTIKNQFEVWREKKSERKVFISDISSQAGFSSPLSTSDNYTSGTRIYVNKPVKKYIPEYIMI